ncbi:MAG: histidine triad nucleotide-binding protein [Peptococcaceae bacterium]|nr:histidine triad nucleotide-binding protein [Peptococcaceae bacterium]MDH7524512.1 histidine triad nucleotide-binding protein [Peptococcaceae bacterium]
MPECVFCKIVKGEIPARKVYEDDQVIAIHDINPVAPVHVLVMPKTHIASLSAAGDAELSLIGRIHGIIRDLAKELELAGGYRVVNNCGPQGGQTVDHIHFHLLGGRSMNWPPG